MFHASSRNAVVSKVSEQRVVCFPPVGNLARVQNDGYVKFGALQAVGGADPDHRSGDWSNTCQRLADLVRLVSVRDSDRDVLSAERPTSQVPFVYSDSSAEQQSAPMEAHTGQLVSPGRVGEPGAEVDFLPDVIPDCLTRVRLREGNATC
jgi:hypothetical protein